MDGDITAHIRFDPVDGLIALAEAMAALADEADRIGFRIDRHAIANELQAATFRRTVPSDVRVVASSRGAIAVEVRDSA